MTTDQQQLFSTPQEIKTSDDYYTPAWIFDALQLQFDLDPASPPGGPPHTPCRHYYTQADNGLVQKWFGRVWLNPPFSKPHAWVDKWHRHNNGLMLTVMSKSKWFDNLWNDTNIAAVALPPTLKFVGGPIFMPTMLWAAGQDNIDALSNIGNVR
jgi:phage N-6-adenine-methyltransferase